MIGGVTHHMLPHLSGVSHLHVNRALECYLRLPKTAGHSRAFYSGSWNICYFSQGWPVVECPTLNYIYYEILPAEEKARVEKVEPFDEFEVFLCELLSSL